MRELAFSIAIMCISRALFVRDVVLGRVRGGRYGSSSRQTIVSGNHSLDAVLTKPADGSERVALLICHGIGETVEHWRPVQQLLAGQGVVSLVFDYSGYGRSAGIFTSSRAEQDAIAAFQWLRANAGGLDISVLGFSLGSAVAAAIVSQLPAKHLVLCSAFTSLRDAAVSGGLPSRLRFLVPPIWNTYQTLSRCAVPVLILHGQQDRLFPAQMASDLKAACRAHNRLVIVPGHSHDAAYRRPQLSLWSSVVSTLLSHPDHPSVSC